MLGRESSEGKHVEKKEKGSRGTGEQGEERRQSICEDRRDN